MYRVFLLNPDHESVAKFSFKEEKDAFSFAKLCLDNGYNVLIDNSELLPY